MSYSKRKNAIFAPSKPKELYHQISIKEQIALPRPKNSNTIKTDRICNLKIIK